MPAGLFQVVGEAGWQLSHGERSRVYMARALLQGADLVVLDESFAELDPDSLQRCLPEAAELSAAWLWSRTLEVASLQYTIQSPQRSRARALNTTSPN